MRHTPLYHTHISHGAKLVDFAGWAMPLHYSGVIDEYQAVRHSAGLFDVSHMGRLLVSGEEALAFLQTVTTNDAARLEVGQAQYSMVCNDQGGIKDDVFVYRVAPHTYLVCVNASNREKILSWFHARCAAGPTSVKIEDQSTILAQLAVQGPASLDILESVIGKDIKELKPRQCLNREIGGGSILVARTGYTGEIGYELYVPSDQVQRLWERCVEAGTSRGLKPAGLGARDLLRLDMGFFLYGNELTEDTTPIEAGAEWVVAFRKGEFIGRPVLIRQLEGGISRRLVGFELLEKAVPRHGMAVETDGRTIGTVTSGNLSPILQKGIGLAYVEPAFAKPKTNLVINVRGRGVPAMVVPLPFYKKSRR